MNQLSIDYPLASGPRLAQPLSILHAIPGRVRLRLAVEDAPCGALLADHLAGRELVREARWSALTRSLIVTYDETMPFWLLAETLPARIFGLPGEPSAATSSLTEVLGPALSLAATVAVTELPLTILVSLVKGRSVKGVGGSILTSFVELALGLILGEVLAAVATSLLAAYAARRVANRRLPATRAALAA